MSSPFMIIACLSNYLLVKYFINNNFIYTRLMVDFVQNYDENIFSKLINVPNSSLVEVRGSGGKGWKEVVKERVIIIRVDFDRFTDKSKHSFVDTSTWLRSIQAEYNDRLLSKENCVRTHMEENCVRTYKEEKVSIHELYNNIKIKKLKILPDFLSSLSFNRYDPLFELIDGFDVKKAHGEYKIQYLRVS
ncbi:hypothetical protein [Leucothrix mucor]|uniref:hypothetical protein n=1 Tax=Leucothrix mucor TaxID=45248 RepID=UPI0012F7D683|nr:hypothetical protein [Leucothrix mucor]